MKKLILACLPVAAMMPFSARSAAPFEKEIEALKSLKWRSISPANMGGRVTDIAGIPGDPSIFYVGAADGNDGGPNNGARRNRNQRGT